MCCTTVCFIFFPCTAEPLWQPARPTTIKNKTAPIYVFSTSWANQAAEAVRDGLYNGIVDYHKAQEKGNGFLSLDSNEKKSSTSKPESDESEEEMKDNEDELEAKPPPPKRGQRSRAKPTAIKETVTPKNARKPAKKSPSIPRAFLRSSVRLRKQRNEPEPEELDDSPKAKDTSSNHTPSPSPSPLLVERRTRGRAARAPRNNRRKQKSPESFPQESESETNSPLTKKIDTDSSDNEKYKNDEEENNVTKKPKLDNTKDSPIGSSPDNPLSKSEPPPKDKDDVNYTICHGTPGSKVDDANQNTYLKPKGPAHVAASSSVTPNETVLSPGATTTPQSQHSQAAIVAEQRPPSKTTPTEHPQIQREANTWNPNLGHQFPGMTPGYPPVYNPALHGMHYPGHPPSIHGSNYHYPVYPWGSAHPQLSEQQRHSAHSLEGTSFMRGGETGGNMTANNALLQQQHRAQLQAAARPPSFPTDAHSNPGLAKPPSTLTHPPLHTLTSPVSASATLGYHTPHAFAPSPSLAPDFHFGSSNPQSHTSHFPYGFDHSASSLQQMHFWQTQQMQSPHHISQIAGIRGPHLPTHMSTPGLWYQSAQPMAQFMPGGSEVPGHYKKTPGKPSKPLPQEKGANHNANNNNNNNNIGTDERTFLNTGPYLAKYQAKAFTNTQGDSSLDQKMAQRGSKAFPRTSNGLYHSANVPTPEEH